MALQRTSPMSLLLIVVVGALVLLSLLATFLDQAPTIAQPESPAAKARAAEDAVEAALDEFKVAVESGKREEAEVALAKVEAELTEVRQLAKDVAHDPTEWGKVDASIQGIALDLGWGPRVCSEAVSANRLAAHGSTGERGQGRTDGSVVFGALPSAKSTRSPHPRSPNSLRM